MSYSNSHYCNSNIFIEPTTFAKNEVISERVKRQAPLLAQYSSFERLTRSKFGLQKSNHAEQLKKNQKKTIIYLNSSKPTYVLEY